MPTPALPEDRDRGRTVITIHGVLTPQASKVIKWQGWIDPQLERFYEHVNLNGEDGRYLLRIFWPWWRRKERERLRRKCIEEFNRSSKHPHVIAHSFGTYTVCGTLEASTRDEFQFHRVILCASIVGRRFNWEKHSRRFNHVLSERGIQDWVVFLAGTLQLLVWVVPPTLAIILWDWLWLILFPIGFFLWRGVGYSGIWGFLRKADEFTSVQRPGAHKSFFLDKTHAETRARDSWIPYLRGADPEEYLDFCEVAEKYLSSLFAGNKHEEAKQMWDDSYERKWKETAESYARNVLATDIAQLGFDFVYEMVRSLACDIAVDPNKSDNPYWMIIDAVNTARDLLDLEPPS